MFSIVKQLFHIFSLLLISSGYFSAKKAKAESGRALSAQSQHITIKQNLIVAGS